MTKKCVYKGLGECPTKQVCLGDICPIEGSKRNGKGATTKDDEKQEELIDRWLSGEKVDNLTIKEIRR